MNLRAKLIVVTLFVGVVPLLVSAITTLRIHQAAFETSVRDDQRRAASQAALTVQEIRNGAVRQFNRAVQALPWSQLSDDELVGALTILFQQDDGIAVVALFNDEGDSVVESIFVRDENDGPHPTGSTALRARLYQASSLQLGAIGESTVGNAFVADDDHSVMIPILTTIKGRSGASWIVTFAWSINSVCRAITTGNSAEGRTLLVDGDGRLLCPGPEQRPLEPVSNLLMDEVAAKGEDVSLSYTVRETAYSAVAARPTLDWVLLVQQPTALAQAPSKSMFKRSVFWLIVSLLIAISAGLYLAQGISSRVKVLANGAEALAKGNLRFRVAQSGDDELAKLGATFNHMGAELEKRRTEIEAWNVTLQDKVEERTKELERAQKQLLESQKISAMSSLAAGLAHEINNPLTSVLGLTQLLHARFARQEGTERTVKSLASIEQQAARIREIVQTLQALSEESSGAFSAIEVADFVAGVAKLIASQAKELNVEVTTVVPENISDIAGDASSLRGAFIHLLTNALAACSDNGSISIRASSLGDNLVKIVIADTGTGIDKENIRRVFEPFFTTKQKWGGKGLGLTEAYRIIQQQHGQIDLESVTGKGTLVTVLMPVYQGKAHLA